MDWERFDELARALAAPVSRRRTVGALAAALAGALRGGLDPAAGAQSVRCRTTRIGERCGQCGVCLRTSEFGAVRCVPFAHACPGGASDDACPSCDPDTLTCRPAQDCGPCGKCVTAMATGCTYFPQGRDGQCNPELNPCNPATGKCYCRRGLTFCDPDCVDLQTDPNHCGQCNYPCRTCENCREGKCVPCDEQCERCEEGRGCVSTCEDRCKACLDGRCVKPDPPICVCSGEEGGGAPSAKRVVLPVVAAAGVEAGKVQPCGEGDAAQCCVPKQCCGEGASARCCGRDQLCCGGVCCTGQECCGGACCAEDETCCGGTCCSAGQQCCDGECRAECDDTCGEGYSACELDPDFDGRQRETCCPDGSPCCPGNWFDKCAADPETGACCGLGTKQCGALCCPLDHNCNQITDEGVDYEVCCPQGISSCRDFCCPSGKDCYPGGECRDCFNCTT
jgi:hypothetical protein